MGRMKIYGALRIWCCDFAIYNSQLHIMVLGGAALQEELKPIPAFANSLLVKNATVKAYPGKFRDTTRRH